MSLVTMIDIYMYHYIIRHLQTKDKSTNEEMERWISECYKKEVDSYVTKIRNFIECIYELLKLHLQCQHFVRGSATSH